MNAKFIVIEGLDGSGKETQAKKTVEKLCELGKKANYISFPNYKHKSSEFVKMYLNGEISKNPNDVNCYAASCFFSIDRYITFITQTKNIYENSDIIICDRYTDSNAIYQMSKINREQWDDYLSWLYDFEYNKLQLLKPHMTIYLNIPVQYSQKLIEKRYNNNIEKKDIHEKNITFLKQCQKTAEYLNDKNSWKTIECLDSKHNIKSVDEINDEIFNCLKSIL